MYILYFQKNLKYLNFSILLRVKILLQITQIHFTMKQRFRNLSLENVSKIDK